ncbi:hypothetical protein [Spelaeicoccus albus]|uniref:DUF308 domain-containing protein n=1 Tax=Spelaeicoccus albus TaxID=1280376 RepID=A0A7Z0D3Y3_9MICO|nr:hypothetical protein [Spelaeicoccus albus]NYI68356.1 hypothetical protein [Spelaeicoccus albus]
MSMAGRDYEEPDFDKEWRSLVARLEDEEPAAGHDLPAADDGRTAGGDEGLGPDADEELGRISDEELDRLWLTDAPGPDQPADDDPASDDAHPSDGDLLWLPNPRVEPEELDEDDEGSYEPPEPPPLGWRESPPALVLCWIGAVCAPLYVLFVVLFWHNAPGYTILIAIGAFIGGVAGLIMSMPDHRDDDDDGAVV